MQCNFMGPTCVYNKTVADDSGCGGAFSLLSAKEDTCNSSADHPSLAPCSCQNSFKYLTLAYGIPTSSASTYLNGMIQCYFPFWPLRFSQRWVYVVFALSQQQEITVKTLLVHGTLVAEWNDLLSVVQTHLFKHHLSNKLNTIIDVVVVVHNNNNNNNNNW